MKKRESRAVDPVIVGTIAGVGLDRAFGDPFGAYHPVALFGRYVSFVEKKVYGDSVARGAAFTLLTVAPPTLLSVWCARRYPATSLAVALASALGGTTLERTGTKMYEALERGDLESARELVPWLCSRDPQALDADGIARATVESLAENTSDATIVPLVYAAFGAPAVVLHRCVNTLDAMVGYKNDRYRNFGKPAALFDDLLAFIPARITAGIHLALAATRGREAEAIRAWREDAPHHPSPNAGPVEATAAACLGVGLGGPTIYPYGVEERPRLGTGPAPTPATIKEAVALSRATQSITVAGVLGVRGLLGLGGRLAQRRRSK